MEPVRNRTAWTVTIAIFAANLFLLAISIPDYRVVVDSGYHVSLAEWYAHHGVAWWDHINFGPSGRPNLQGPALHIAIAILGRALGGAADNYILANAILAVAQWCAAIGTAYFFARKFGGDIAAMFAVALLAGAVFASASFYVGIPSGWVFIATPWAIYFFLGNRLASAASITALACYTHLGGYLTVPLGILIAAGMERKWRALAIVGLATGVLTLPYTIHFLSNLEWYRGRHGHEAFNMDVLLDLLGIAGLTWIVARRPRNTFLIAWAFAPVAWAVQDYGRLILQGSLAASVLAGLMLAHIAGAIRSRRARVAFASAIVAIATIWPFNIPNLVAEGSWAAGLRSPRMLDWHEARSLADAIERNHLNGRLLQVYEASFGPAIAVFTPVVLQRGHWVEVQPRHDPAGDLSAGVKAYVLPLAPDDPFLLEMRDRGLVHVWGGTGESAVVTLGAPADRAAARDIFVRTVSQNARWLAANAVGNRRPAPTALRSMLRDLAAHQASLNRQRFAAARMDLATLIYAYALESSDPDHARGLRNAASAFGGMANFLSDGDAIGFESDAQMAAMRKNLLALADALEERVAPSEPDPVGQAFDRLFHNFFGSAA